MMEKKVNRNDNCWCGSGKKYKRCHLPFDEKLQELKRDGYPIPKRSIIKTPEQIEGIRKSCSLTKHILDELTSRIKAGVTTNEINDWVHDYTLKHNAVPAPLNYKGFPKSICTSINEVICHGIPEDRKLVDGDIINVDVTCILNGYYGDSCRMYSIGNISKEAKKLVETTKHCLDEAIKALSPFCSLNRVGDCIQEIANNAGYSVVKLFGGHGIGNKFHEEPFVYHNKLKEKQMICAPGMVFTIEPMINEGTYKAEILQDNWTAVTKDRKLSAQWEHTILITDTGTEILT